VCEFCGTSFTRRYNLVNHIEQKHNKRIPSATYKCHICGLTFSTDKTFREHTAQHKPDNQYKVVANALRAVILVYEKKLLNTFSVDQCFVQTRDIEEIIQYELQMKRVIKASINLIATYAKFDVEGDREEITTITLHSKYFTLYRDQNIAKFINLCKSQLTLRSDDFVDFGSGWSLSNISHMRISIARVSDFTGGCKDKNINLKSIAHRRHTVDPPSKDGMCFYNCIANYFTNSEDETVLNAFVKSQFKKSSVNGPMHVKNIGKFESQNSHMDFRINVVLYEPNGEISPIYNSKNREAKNRISLVLVYTNTDDCGHYLRITDFNFFCKKRYVNADGKITYSKGYFCHSCLSCFRHESTLFEHVKMCEQRKLQKIIMPNEENKILSFRDWNRTLPMGLIGFCDFESCMIDVKSPCLKCEDMQNCCHRTTYSKEHSPIMFSLIILDIDCNVIKDFTYAGVDATERLLHYLLDVEDELSELVNRNLPGTYTVDDMQAFADADTCGICGRDFVNPSDRVMHHSHFTGRFLAAAHAKCNLNCQNTGKLNIYIHNLSNYDSHFLIQSLDKCMSRIHSLKFLPYNSERFRSMEINSFYVFLDSINMLTGSLASICSDLVASNHDFKIMRKLGMYKNDEEKSMLLRKGVYPYSYIRSVEHLLEMKCIPSREAFRSDLTGEDISEADYQFACRFFRIFSCVDMLDFSFVYCKLDTVILAEAFVRLRELVINETMLDPAHFLSCAHLTFNMMLKTSKVDIELITDPEKLSFVENSLKGGHCFISERYVRASDTHRLGLYDANNLYGRAMLELMPVSDFRWLTRQEMHDIDWAHIDLSGETGYYCQVTLAYPSHLHKAHNSFPLAPEKIKITYDQLSPYSKRKYLQLYLTFVNSRTLIPYF
jgi:hypothetical protein